MAKTMHEQAKWFWDKNLMNRGITGAGEKMGAKFQLRFIQATYDVAAEDKSAGYGWKIGNDPVALLAHDIMRDQKERIALYGEKAHPLTERQVAAICRDLRSNARWSGTQEGEVRN